MLDWTYQNQAIITKQTCSFSAGMRNQCLFRRHLQFQHIMHKLTNFPLYFFSLTSGATAPQKKSNPPREPPLGCSLNRTWTSPLIRLFPSKPVPTTVTSVQTTTCAYVRSVPDNDLYDDDAHVDVCISEFPTKPACYQSVSEPNTVPTCRRHRNNCPIPMIATLNIRASSSRVLSLPSCRY